MVAGYFLVFGPRWLIAIPLIILFPLAVWKKRGLIFSIIAALLIVIGPIMGFTVPLGNVATGSHSLRIITCNLQNGAFNHATLNALIENKRPDVVALQELPNNHKIKALGEWNHIFEGDLHIFSKYQLIKGDFKKGSIPQHVWPRPLLLYCTVATPAGNVSFCSLHLPSPRYGLQHILDKKTLLSLKRKNLLIDETMYRRKISGEISNIVVALSSPKIIAGDFNMPVESSIYRECWSKYSNAFSNCGTGYGWTQRASVRGIPVGVRIDHVLTDEYIIPTHCEIGPDVGSDHLPVIADISFK